MTEKVESRIELIDEEVEVSKVRSKRKKIGGLELIPMSEIVATEYPEMKWAVKGFIPEGLTLLAGNPKCGKSWTVLEMLRSVSLGEPAFGGMEVEQGNVIYLALEDTGRRIKQRYLMLSGEDVPQNALVATHSPSLDEGLVKALERWILYTGDIRLIIIDVFGKIRGEGAGGKLSYQNDYKELENLKQMADRFSTSVLVILHTSKKTNPDDIFKNILGTQGTTGCADTMIVMDRPRNSDRGIFHMTSRDMEDGALGFNFEDGIITITEDIPELEKEFFTKEDEIVQMLEESNSPLSNKEILKQMSVRYPQTTGNYISKTLSKLKRENRILQVDRGFYSVKRNRSESDLDEDEP